MKKTISFICALIMILACTCASADGDNGANGVNGVYGAGNSISIEKQILVANTDTAVTTVYGPSVTYSYSIAAASVGTQTVSDGTNTAVVKAGIMSAVDAASKTISFTSNAVTLSSGKNTVSSSFTLTFTPATFGAPGIYRYVITDTTDATTLSGAGIMRASNYQTAYYLDVYVVYTENADKTPENLMINGYALLKENTDISSSAQKQSGYSETQGLTGSENTWSLTAGSMDSYQTYNVQITKTVEGNMADATHDFSFIARDGNNAALTHCYHGLAASASDATTQASGEVPQFTLHHGQSYWLVGLNQNQQVQITETNDTNDTYQMQVKLNSTVDTAAASIAKDETISSQPHAVAAVATGGVTDQALAFEFIAGLTTVSPTGLVVRVLPYAVLLGFAFFFMLVSKKRRDEREAEE